MEHMLYWLWLTLKKHISHAKINALIEYFGSIEDIYLSKRLNDMSGLSEEDKAALEDKSLEKAEKVVEKMLRLNAKIIVYDSPYYPEQLKNIGDPPCVLYIQGKIPDMANILTIGVVGTRESSDYGRIVTERICSDLAKSGVITVNGLARGIDTVGAWATLDAGGTAVAVVGNGLDIVYPNENEELVKEISEKGCIISEYPPETRPLWYNFPQRNRIIAGLSRGILVTEAPKKSGALITARYALENNRDVFAVPRNITDIKYRGTNLIIQQGAKLVNSADDIICEYPYAVKTAPLRENRNNIEKNKSTKKNLQPKMSEKFDKLTNSEKEIVNILRKRDAQIDEIARILKIPVSELNTRLIMLEMKGIIKKLPQSTYQLKIN